MRRGEVFGLKWEDINFERGQLRVVRSIVDQKVGETKTRGSKRPLPLSNEVIAALRAWREATPYGKNEDWVFASPQALEDLPLWPNAVLVRQARPATNGAGTTKLIGWHTLRQTLATLLHSSGAAQKVTQNLLRHSSPAMKMGTDAQAVTDDKRDAQAVVSALFARPTENSATNNPKRLMDPYGPSLPANGPSGYSKLLV
jgi:integrase